MPFAHPRVPSTRQWRDNCLPKRYHRIEFMPIWNRLSAGKGTEDARNIGGNEPTRPTPNPKLYAFIDAEIGLKDHRVHDIGALRYDGATFHQPSKAQLIDFLSGVDFVCGHNIVHHDAKYLFGEDDAQRWLLVDTLYLSPLLFPERPYHRLVKDDKLMVDELNNPVNDCEKAKALLDDEMAHWQLLPAHKRRLYAALLWGKSEFEGFLRMVGAEQTAENLPQLIAEHYAEKLCSHAPLAALAEQYPCELAYALALIDTSDQRSVTPGWVLYNYPATEYVVKQLRHTPCKQGCAYCNAHLDIVRSLETHFGYHQFRTYEGEPLQQRAVEAAVQGQSLLAIFPTGGGKSLTFQLPALMAGTAMHGLTVVISPLQSLMKDQVDNLSERGITDAVSINGLLDPISRASSIERVQDGSASLLYISPEMLRSKTIERMLSMRHVVRFVIDEAHCLSSWGQDFRVDYLYIGKFIRRLQEQKHTQQPIPVSCFTATAKQKVVQDICDYFQQTLGLKLELYASTATRTNLRYSVAHADDANDKYSKLRALVAEDNCPTIVYVSRTKRTRELAAKLTRDGYEALPFNGKMDADEKTHNQEAFMNDDVRIIVATSAFGMGVDKKDVGLVVHYDISDSLENYVQEAGRAGRDPSLNAKCYVLYSDNDLDKHFVLLNQTKLSISEIQQVWKAVKSFTRQRPNINCSALEIARQAGWDDGVSDIETRVRTALAALEEAGYLVRGNNVPHVYATGITVCNMNEARMRIEASLLFDNNEREKAARIIKSLISKKHIAKAQDAEAESRIDYLADTLGIPKAEIMSVVVRMRQEGILADSKDMLAYLRDTGENERKSNTLLERFARLEQHLLGQLHSEPLVTTYKQLNDNAVKSGISSATEKDIRTLLYFLTIKGYTRKKENAARYLQLTPLADAEAIVRRFERRLQVCRFAVEWLYALVQKSAPTTTDNVPVQFSVVRLLNDIKAQGQGLFSSLADLQIEEVEESLLYLAKIGALKLDGGFLVIYNAMSIRRTKDNLARYKKDDYRTLDDFYRQRMQQIHIVGEYANLMVKDYAAAQQFVKDYFQMDYRLFVSKYFKGERASEIQRNITPSKYKQLFGDLSSRQKEIISDKETRCIVVAAGPGSGKTRVLVHKLASLLMLEDVKHEQLLMLTFSRAAATEFKQRLLALIGNAAHFVEIKTFHAYCFDLLGRIGNLDETENVVQRAADMIKAGEVEPNKIAKTVLVIDEAQDMADDEYALVEALMAQNEDMRVIAVGDDDQNIFEFRGSNSAYMQRMAQAEGSRLIEMTDNYRSDISPVAFANHLAKALAPRMKTTPNIAVSNEKGWTEVVHHHAKCLYLPVADALINHKDSGTTCLLTQTNEEAVIMQALLRRKGLNAKLIQSMDDFRFWNMAETRYFLRKLENSGDTSFIPNDIWQQAKEKTFEKYQQSEALPYLKRCLEVFEATNREKYATDFKEFVFESSVEDFCDVSKADVVVSTIHKAKGREFDNVYLLVAGAYHADQSLLHRYYVAITRAKRRLYVHTNGNCFDCITADKHTIDTNTHDMPDEVVLQLSHKDVFLGYFKNLKPAVLALRSGDELHFERNILFRSEKDNTSLLCQPVAKLSKNMAETLAHWAEKGYEVQGAKVRFVVAWRPKDAPKDEKDTAIVLADLRLMMKK